MFGHWDRLGPRLPFETPGSLPRADSLGVSSSAWFQPERIRIERPPIIIDSILRLISNGNGVEESADMISPGEVDRRRAQSARLVLQSGLDRGEKAAHIVDPENREEHLKRLADAGIPAQKIMNTGQLDVLPWTDAYVLDHRLDQDVRLATVEKQMQSGAAAGYHLLGWWDIISTPLQ